jgi:pimeloyl-ACP methyl ester carboxylesterase
VTNAELSDDDLAGLDEFGLLHENAEQIGVTGPLPSVQRIESGPISALKWGDVTVAAAPNRDRKSLRRSVFHNSKRLDDGTWTWRYDSFRKGDGFANLWDDVPAITMPTTLVRGANSHFVNDEDAEAFATGAPGFLRTHVVADSGHSVQGDQPAALVDILRGLLTR